MDRFRQINVITIDISIFRWYSVMLKELSNRFPRGMADAGHRAPLRHLYAIKLYRAGGEDGASRVQGEELGESNGKSSENPSSGS